jgi:hypothetical protein
VAVRIDREFISYLNEDEQMIRDVGLQKAKYKKDASAFDTIKASTSEKITLDRRVKKRLYRKLL